MFIHVHARSRFTRLFRYTVFLILLFFIPASVIVPGTVSAQNLPQTSIHLPLPGVMVQTSADYTPALIRGLRMYANNPLMFDFIIDQGEETLAGPELQAASKRLIKYFLASLTIPEDKLWVNLSPYEEQRIISAELEKTEMGRDLLGMDYLLKQLTASLMYPENALGKSFWERVKKKAVERFGSNDIPMNSFNKIWVVPADALVFEQDGGAYVIESRLKVMLEEDYIALEQNTIRPELLTNPDEKALSGIASDVVREVLIPELEQEINHGRHFAQLRQIYHAMILATWYKQTLRDTLLSKVYVDQGKINGIDTNDEQMKEKIYQQYLEAFKVGVYNYVREEYDESQQQMIPRKFFSGGAAMDVSRIFRSQTELANLGIGQFEQFLGLLDANRLSDTSRQQLLAKIQSLAAEDRARIQQLLQRGIVDNGIARIVEVQISLLENPTVDLEQAADNAVLAGQNAPIPIRTITLANRSIRPEEVLVMINEVRRMLTGEAPVINVPTYPRPDQTSPQLLLAAITEGAAGALTNARFRNYEAFMNEIGEQLGFFVITDFTGPDRAEPRTGRVFTLDDVGGKLTNPGSLGTAFYTTVPQAAAEREALVNRIRTYLDELENRARPVLEQNLADVMNPANPGQVVILANNGFNTDALTVARFLISGRENVLGLLGPANLPAQGFVDQRWPKAIQFSRAELEAAGITVPASGIINSEFLAQVDLEPLQASIRRLEEQGAGNLNFDAIRLLGLMLENLNRDFNPFSPVQVQLAEATQNFLQPSFGFTGPQDVSAVFPILDIRVRDAQGNEQTIWVHRRSPVLTSEVEILGIGPQTERVWRSILENASAVIVIGQQAGLEGVLGNVPEGQRRIVIDASDTRTIQEMNQPAYWNDLSSRQPATPDITADVTSRPLTEHEQVSQEDERYRTLDVEGVLAANGVDIFLADELLPNLRRNLEAMGVEVNTDMLMHPAFRGNALYFAPEAMNIILQQKAEYRAALVRHYLVHLQQPELSESEANAIAALPSLSNPLYAQATTPTLNRLAATPQELVNAAVEELVGEEGIGVGILTRRQLTPGSEEYNTLDPDGILAQNGIRIFAVPNLMDQTLEIARNLGLDLPADAVIQPGRRGGDFYVDPVALQIIATQTGAYRSALARHHLLQWQLKDNQELSLADIERISPMPRRDNPEFIDLSASERPLPVIRQGIAPRLEELINEALTVLTDELGVGLITRQRVARDSDLYRRLDPTGQLANADVTIYVMPGLMDKVSELAEDRDVDITLDVLMHPGVRGNALYFDQNAINTISAQSVQYRMALAAHQLLHLQQTGLTEAQVEEQAPLPVLVLTPTSEQRRLFLERMQEKLSDYGPDALQFLNEILSEMRLFQPRQGENVNLVLMRGNRLDNADELEARRQFITDVVLETIQEINPQLAQFLTVGVGTVRRRGPQGEERVRALAINFKTQPYLTQRLNRLILEQLGLERGRVAEENLQQLIAADRDNLIAQLTGDLQYSLAALRALQQLQPVFRELFPQQPLRQGMALTGAESGISVPYVMAQPAAEGESPLIAIVSGPQVVIQSGQITQTRTGLLRTPGPEQIVFDTNPKVDFRFEFDGQTIDAAQLANVRAALQPAIPVGGIDLNAALLNLQIKRDGKGFPLPVNQQPVQDMNISGFTPIILKITPLTNPRILLNF